MFQSQKMKESIKTLEDTLTVNHMMLLSYEKTFNEINQYENQVAECIETTNTHYAIMDEDINSASDNITKAHLNEQSMKKHLNHAANSLLQMGKEAKRTNKRMALTAVKIRESKKDFINNDMTMTIQLNAIVKEFDEMKEKLSDMANLYSQFMVLSLNVAIEAGRLGEQGNTIIDASEEVRKLAVESQKMFQDLLDRMFRISGFMYGVKDTFSRFEKVYELGSKAFLEVTESIEDIKQPISDVVIDNITNAYNFLSNLCTDDTEIGKTSGAVKDIKSRFKHCKQTLDTFKKIQENMNQTIEMADDYNGENN